MGRKIKIQDPKAERVRVYHTFGPYYNADSRFLILGSFPSVKSREANFYYGHPQNRFWSVLDAVFSEKAGGEICATSSIEEKKAFLKKYQVALYDVIDSCTITGSSDSSIKDVTVTDLAPILSRSHIGNRIFVNGGKAFEMYKKYTYSRTGIEPVRLPSTSPANAAWHLDRLIREWKRLITERDKS